MSETSTNTSRELARDGERVLGRIIAIAAGVALMIAGIGMGVTIVLLPLGIPVGFAGLALFLWGIFGRPENGTREVTSPASQAGRADAAPR